MLRIIPFRERPSDGKGARRFRFYFQHFLRVFLRRMLRFGCVNWRYVKQPCGRHCVAVELSSVTTYPSEQRTFTVMYSSGSPIFRSTPSMLSSRIRPMGS
jgi:hypothetical protein